MTLDQALARLADRTFKPSVCEPLAYMGFDTCPKCGHQGLQNKRETRHMENGEVHEVTVQRCQCGWQNI